MNLVAKLETVDSKDDLADFIDQLRHDYENNPNSWENVDLAAYLEAMSAWLGDMDGYYQRLGKPIPNSPSWKLIGEILIASRMYE